MSLPRIYSSFTLLAIALFLGACAAVQPTPTESPLSTAPAVNEGTLVVSLTVNNKQLTSLGSIVVEEVLTEKNSNKKATQYRVYSNRLINSDTYLYVGNLPQGTYRLATLDGYPYEVHINNNGATGTFTIEANKISDLGRLIATAVNAKVGVGRSESYIDNQQQIKKYLPELLEKAQLPIADGWDSPKNTADIMETFALTYPIGLKGFTEIGGRVIAASGMGALYLRSQDGEWKKITTMEDYFPVIAIAEYPIDDNLLILGGADKNLFRLTKKREVYPFEAGNLGSGNIEFIDHDALQQYWYVGVRGKAKIASEEEEVDRLALFRSRDIASGQWEKFAETSVRWDAWSGQTHAWVWHRPGGLGFASTRLNEVQCFDYKSQEWTQNSIPEKQRLIGLLPGANGAFGILTGKGGGFAGVFASTYYTTDCGATWNETFSPYKVKAKPPLVLHDGTVLEGGGVFADAGIYASKTPGNKDSWEKIVEGQVITEQLFLTSKGELIMISDGNWGYERIKSSRDGGRTWEVEKSTFDPFIQKAIDQNKK